MRPFLFAEFYTTTAIVQSYSLTTDAGMGETETYTTKTSVGTAGSIACTLQPMSSTMVDQFARYNIYVDHVLICSTVYDIAKSDKIVVGTRQFLVKGVQQFVSHIGTVFEVMLQEILP